MIRRETSRIAEIFVKAKYSLFIVIFDKRKEIWLCDPRCKAPVFNRECIHIKKAKEIYNAKHTQMP